MNFLPHRQLATLVLLAGAGLAFLPGNARAETFQTCAGFIDSLPATISTQGVWCLKKDLTTSITSGTAITIATNNVTIDCNDFKIGGLAAGDTSIAVGIYADARQNATVRHCSIRGFAQGVNLDGGAGHLVQDNRFDNNLIVGIHVSGENTLVRGNRVFDTGGNPASSMSAGIVASAHVIDNTVSGVFAAGANASPAGIIISQSGNVASGNRVSGLLTSGSGKAVGISAGPQIGITVDGNQVTAPVGTPGSGIDGAGVAETVCTNNVSIGFTGGMTDCKNAGGNTSL